MLPFMRHIPERYRNDLREAIEGVTATKLLLDQTRTRFGTHDPIALQAMIGQVFDGATVTRDSVRELEKLRGLHEVRRVRCRKLMSHAVGAESA